MFFALCLAMRQEDVVIRLHMAGIGPLCLSRIGKNVMRKGQVK